MALLAHRKCRVPQAHPWDEGMQTRRCFPSVLESSAVFTRTPAKLSPSSHLGRCLASASKLRRFQTPLPQALPWGERNPCRLHYKCCPRPAGYRHALLSWSCGQQLYPTKGIFTACWFPYAAPNKNVYLRARWVKKYPE